MANVATTPTNEPIAIGTLTTSGDWVQLDLTPGLPTVLIQVTGTFTGTVAFEAAPDTVPTWYAIQANVMGGTSIVTTVASTGAFSSVYRVNVAGFLQFRVRMSAFTSGSAVVLLRSSPHVALITSSDPGTGSPGTTGQQLMANSAPVVLASDETVPVKGATATFAQTANTAGNVVGHAGACSLWNAHITTTGTAGLNVYDNATTNAGTVLLAIPANAAVGTIYSFQGGQPAANGLVSAGVANCPGVTFSFH